MQVNWFLYKNGLIRPNLSNPNLRPNLLLSKNRQFFGNIFCKIGSKLEPDLTKISRFREDSKKRFLILHGPENGLC